MNPLLLRKIVGIAAIALDDIYEAMKEEERQQSIADRSYRDPASNVGMKPDTVDFLIPDDYTAAYNSANTDIGFEKERS